MNTLPVDKAMVIRTLLFLLAWLNQFLVVNGYSPLPFDNEQAEVIISSVITFALSLWTWWKNNDITRKARQKKGDPS